MKKSELEKHLGKFVEIKISDGDVYKGKLHKTREERFKGNANLYLPNNYYFLINPTLPISICCVSCIFKSSHVKKSRRIENE